MKSFITDFRSALMFITILPAGKSPAYSPMGMIRCFPLVGLVIGFLLILADRAVSAVWPPGVAAVLDTLFLVAVTGAFHLDGLGDSADGMFSHRPKERVLEIMKDSRTGMMGLVAVVCVLAVKAAGLYAMKTALPVGKLVVMLFIIPAYARAAMIFGIKFLNYGRKGTGTGLDLFEKPLGLADFVFFAPPAVISLFLGVHGLVLNMVFALTLFLVLTFYQRKLGCITGDMLGALNEVMEAVLFLAAGAVLAA